MTFGDFVKTWSRVLDVQAQVVTLPIEEILKGTPGDLEPDVREMLAQGMANMTEFGYKLREDPELMQPSAVSQSALCPEKYSALTGQPPQLKSHPHLPSVEKWIREQDWSSVLRS